MSFYAGSMVDGGHREHLCTHAADGAWETMATACSRLRGGS